MTIISNNCLYKLLKWTTKSTKNNQTFILPISAGFFPGVHHYLAHHLRESQKMYPHLGCYEIGYNLSLVMWKYFIGDIYARVKKPLLHAWGHQLGKFDCCCNFSSRKVLRFVLTFWPYFSIEARLSPSASLVTFIFI